ncbi:hypothetical protein SBADM41S_04823 [Streptomyces badius]
MHAADPRLRPADGAGPRPPARPGLPDLARGAARRDLAEHIREEEGHDWLLLEDLRAAGGAGRGRARPAALSPIASLVGSSTTGSSTTTQACDIAEAMVPASTSATSPATASLAAAQPDGSTGLHRHTWTSSAAAGTGCRCSAWKAGGHGPALPRRAHPAVRPARALRAGAVAAGAASRHRWESHHDRTTRQRRTGATARRVVRGGLPVDLLTEEQREVLSGLTPEELALLLDVKSQLDAGGAGSGATPPPPSTCSPGPVRPACAPAWTPRPPRPTASPQSPPVRRAPTSQSPQSAVRSTTPSPAALGRPRPASARPAGRRARPT